MTYIRNPRQPFMWESDGEYSGKFKSDDGTLHDSPKEADMHDLQRRSEQRSKEQAKS